MWYTTQRALHDRKVYGGNFARCKYWSSDGDEVCLKVSN